MELKPTTITSDLAAAALECAEMVSALKLARWIGDGKPVTASGVLRPADAVLACAALGVELPAGKNPRSAMDLPGLMFPWDAALGAGLINVSGKRVYQRDRMDLSEDPAAALDVWLGAVAGSLGLPDEPCAECLLTLIMTAGAEPGTAAAVADLVDVICVLFAEPCEDCGEIHADEDEPEPEEHVLAALTKLILFGAVREVSADSVTVTPLGEMLVESVSALFEPAPEDDAEAVAGRLADLPLPLAAVFVRPWLAARTVTEAAGELLDLAKTTTPLRRAEALDLVRALGPEALPAWRERATEPGYGAYIRAWLEEQGEPAPVFPRDRAWLAADSLSAMLSQAPPEIAASALTMAAMSSEEEFSEIVKLLDESGHPDGQQLLGLIRKQPPFPDGQQVHAGPGATPWPALTPADTKSYQLKITLRGVGEPDVWRRVAVAGSTTLDRLHYVIQDAMGWENDHMYAFRAGRRELTDDTPLRVALPKRGSKIVYEYDFGDSWEHDIQSEGFFPNEQGVTLPVCIDGAGACPPEDCGGPWGYEHLQEVLLDPGHEEYYDRLDWMGLDDGSDLDPAAFSVEEADSRLDWMRRPAGPRLTGTAVTRTEIRIVPPEMPVVRPPVVRPEVAVVRSQARAKKPKVKRKR